MKILVLGGTGVISRAIVREGLAKGHEMTVFNRGSKKCGFEDQVTTILGDRKNVSDFTEKMKSVDADVVIDMISFNEEDAKETVNIFSGKVKQMIFTSSSAAYAKPYAKLPVREEEAPLTEDPAFNYGFQKAKMERYLESEMEEGKTPITIIRPSLTFGEGCANIGALRQNANIVSRIKNGKALVVPGDGTAAWSYTFAPDLAKGYILSCLNPAAYNTAFHITNEEQVEWMDLYRVVGKILGIEPKFAYVPSAVLCAADPGLFAHFEYEKKHCHLFSVDKFRKAAPEYKPTISLEEGMRSMMAWWEEAGIPVDEEKDRMEDKICEAYERFLEDMKKTLE